MPTECSPKSDPTPGLQQAQLACPRDRFVSIVYVELLVESAQLSLDGVDGHVQFVGHRSRPHAERQEVRGLSARVRSTPRYVRIPEMIPQETFSRIRRVHAISFRPSIRVSRRPPMRWSRTNVEVRSDPRCCTLWTTPERRGVAHPARSVQPLAPEAIPSVPADRIRQTSRTGDTAPPADSFWPIR